MEFILEAGGLQMGGFVCNEDGAKGSLDLIVPSMKERCGIILLSQEVPY
jgi:hypothetical protein